MHSEVVKEIRRLRSKGYSTNDVARMTGSTADQVRYAMRTKFEGNRENGGSPDELIDGERLEDRIKRMTARPVYTNLD